MLLIRESIKRFYTDILPVDMPSRIYFQFSLSIIILSVLGVSILGFISLAIFPLILIIVLSLKYRMFLLYFFLASFPLSTYYISGSHRLFSYSLVFIIIAFWFCRKILVNDRTLQYSRFMIGFICFFSFAIILTTFNNGITNIEILSIIRYSIFFPLVLIIYDMYDPKSKIPIMIAIVVPSLVSAYYLFSVYLNTSGVFDFLQLYRMKPAGIFGNANTFGAQILFAAPFWIALAIWGKNKYLKAVSGLVGFILLISTILTNSRAAIVGLIAAIIFYFIVARKTKYLFAIVTAVIIIFAASPSLRNIISVGLRVDRGGSNRELIWNNAFDIIKKNFLFGVGAGNFTSEYRPYLRTSYEKGFVGSVPHAHNEVIHSIAVYGVLGFIIIIVMFYVPLKRGFTLMKKPLSVDDRPVVYGLMGILIANSFRAIFDASVVLRAGGLYPTILYWITMIMIFKMLKEYENRSNEANPVRISF